MPQPPEYWDNSLPILLIWVFVLVLFVIIFRSILYDESGQWASFKDSLVSWCRRQMLAEQTHTKKVKLLLKTTGDMPTVLYLTSEAGYLISWVNACLGQIWMMKKKPMKDDRKKRQMNTKDFYRQANTLKTLKYFFLFFWMFIEPNQSVSELNNLRGWMLPCDTLMNTYRFEILLVLYATTILSEILLFCLFLFLSVVSSTISNPLLITSLLGRLSS